MLDGFEALASTPHLDFGVDRERRVLLLVRHNSGDATAGQLEAALAEAHASLGAPTGWSILFDVRAAVGRSDPEFEAHAQRFRAAMLAQFTRVAVLVRSAVGQLQVQRIAGPEVRMAVFRDLDDALAFLAQ